MTDPLADLTKEQLADYAARAGIRVRANASRETLVSAITAAAEQRAGAVTSTHRTTGQTAEEFLEHLGFPGQPGHPSQ